MKVLCFGSLNIDYTYRVPHFVSRGETLCSEDLAVFSGGKGLNQSIALARAGADVYHAGAVGEDGRFLLRELEASGVDTAHVAVLPSVRTGHAIIQNTPDGDNCILLYGGANRAVTEEQVRQTLSQFQSGDLLVLQNEISALPALIEYASQRGLRIALNPSPMEDALLSLPMEKVDYLLLNEVEAAQFLSAAVTDGAAAVELLRKTLRCAVVVLTMGKQGSYCADGKAVYHQCAYPAEAVDTTAAGDTYTGYFLAAVQEGKPLQEAMALGAKAAAISVTVKGAAPSIPHRRDVRI